MVQDIVTFINELDLGILRGIQDVFQSSLLDKVMPIITSLGNGGVLWIIISLMLIITKKYRKAGIIALMALLITTILGDVIIKNIIRSLSYRHFDTCLFCKHHTCLCCVIAFNNRADFFNSFLRRYTFAD